MLLRRSTVRTHAAAVATEPCPSRSRPIDLVHLARQTLGDRELEREVLGLMAKQIHQCELRIDLATARERQTIAHALKGAARNVGAFALAERADGVESGSSDEAALAAFRTEMRRTAAFIATLLG